MIMRRWLTPRHGRVMPAQFNLGALYANGHGVEQDNVDYKWWLLAVMQLHVNANDEY